MDYETLNAAWALQKEQYNLWKVTLMNYPKVLREHFEEKLSPPETFWTVHDTKEQYRYVDLVDFYNKSAPERKQPSDTSITPDGVLAFGISITFAHGPNTYPKQNMFVPVAIRFNDHQLEHAIFDMDENTVVEDWFTDKDVFFGVVAKKLHEYLTHDPRSGFGLKKRPIGFVS